jgi:hypothetical protein
MKTRRSARPSWPFSPMPADGLPSRKFRFAFLGLYFFHVLHVLEEFWGEFRAVRIMGPFLFLAANAVLLAIPLAILHYALENNRTAMLLVRIYAAIMICNGLGHGLAVIISGRYFGFAAGAVSGIGLIVFGWLTLGSGLFKKV